VARRGERWEIATANTDGSNLTIWTAGKPGLRDLNAPLTWSPDSQRIAFTSTTAPYESDIFVLDTRDGSLTNVTQDVWYDEAPSWTPDGTELVFMSTRGGGWTWGLFGLSFATGDLRQIAEPDYVEKSSPRLYQDGWGLWMQVDKCLGASYIVERTPIGDIRLLWDHPGARWPSRSPDGSAYLFTIVNRTVQYWLATWSAVKSQI
jgi:TolB protein